MPTELVNGNAALSSNDVRCGAATYCFGNRWRRLGEMIILEATLASIRLLRLLFNSPTIS